MSYVNFCIYKHKINPYSESLQIYPSVYTNRKIPEYKSHYIILSGDVYNIKDIKERFAIKSSVAEEIILELYFKVGEKTPNYLKGIFAIVVINSEKIILFRDYFSISSIYYYIDNTKNEFIITNKIREIKKFMNLKVNVGVLPRFFLRTSLHIGDTFFENIRSLEFAQLLKLSIKDNKLIPIIYDDSFYKEIKNEHLKENTIISKTEDIIYKNIKEIVNYYANCNVINALSGGVDSSYIQVLLKKIGFNKAYTFAHELLSTGVIEYSTDISKYLEIEHNVFKLKSEYIIDSIKNGILTCEVPYIFEAEFLENYMYAHMSKKEGKDILITHGQGADAIFTYGRAFFILKYLNNPIFLSLFSLVNECFLKVFDFKEYKHNKTIIQKLKKKIIDEELLYLLFDQRYHGEFIKKAFSLENMYKMYSIDIERIRKFQIDFVEKLYRWRYDFDFKRASFITYELCKQYDLNVCFPYIDKELLFYMCSIPLSKKIRRLTDKFYKKKLLLKHLPSKFVYRKKIKTGDKNFLLLFNDGKIAEIIKAIKNSKYDYFNFDCEAIYSDEKYYGLAIKLINFYIWHKIFIENVDIKDI